MKYLNELYSNIERFYEENKEELLCDKGSLKPGKSFNKDIFSPINKFKEYYKINKNNEISFKTIMDEICLPSGKNTVDYNIEMMTEHSLLSKIDENTYTIEQKLIDCNDYEEIYEEISTNSEETMKNEKDIKSILKKMVETCDEKYSEKHQYKISIYELMNIIKTDPIDTGIRVMTELGFLNKNESGNYEFTTEFIDLADENENVVEYFKKKLLEISEIKDLNRIYNLVICALREGYRNGEIILFPDKDETFTKNPDLTKEENVKYCQMVYELYGYLGKRGKADWKDGDYSPNANERIINTLTTLGLVAQVKKENEITSYALTKESFELLRVLNINLEKSVRGNVATIKSKVATNIDHPHNRILFGAPGTGKSHTLKKNSNECFHEGNVERVTFHPNYSYSQFVGTYKPKPVTVGGTDITYEYVPGPFLRQLVKAMKSKMYSKNNGTVPENYLLIIEEINRANVASVFGDVFQLLDRNGGESEYSITTSEDMRVHLADKLGGDKEEYKSIKLPNNFYIWATMNSADQGVFPMDTAFKRRWSFEYIDIDAGQEKIEEIIVKLGKNKEKVKWNELRNKINDKLINLNINEDKLLGPFFLSLEELQSEDKFDRAFKSKLLMYLYEDVLRHKKGEFFKISQNGKLNTSTYSKLVNSYDEFGGDIFDFELDYESPEIEPTENIESEVYEEQETEDKQVQ